jgi:hypothetical protein
LRGYFLSNSSPRFSPNRSWLSNLTVDLDEEDEEAVGQLRGLPPR